MPNRSAVTAPPSGFDRVFRALADPTRLAVVERLGEGPAATSELADGFAMALPSFLQHLKVLEECGLVASHKQGRVRTYRLTPEPLRAAEGWLSEQRDVWERRLDRLDEHLATMHTTTTEDTER
jgi:DNA-binding transcriptional ArsR family regulator